jgi:hypothetical protein
MPINHFGLGLLNSRLTRYCLKNFIGASVHNEVEEVKQISLVIPKDGKAIVGLVEQIIEKQHRDPRYDYMTNEQVEIDRLVYRLYNLSAEDIAEVEDWFWRRYPKLARAIERNR